MKHFVKAEGQLLDFIFIPPATSASFSVSCGSNVSTAVFNQKVHLNFLQIVRIFLSLFFLPSRFSHVRDVPQGSVQQMRSFV